MSAKMGFCEECRRDVAYTEKEAEMKSDLKGEAYEYPGMVAVCDECGSEIYSHEIEDYNLKALYDSYRKRNSIISLENILKIPEKYGIGKRPLSLLLGWGELTFTRYCDGDLPSKQYSDILQQIFDDPTYYKTILEGNKNYLKSQLTYEKSKLATEELIGLQRLPKEKMDVAIEYLLCKCEDITPLALQKALYYVQGFYYAFMEEFIFDSDCEAWAHGPAYREIYQRYSMYRFDPIEGSEICSESNLSSYEKAVIDSVIRNLCCYSGKVLEGFTHAEEPWLKTRGDLPASAASDRVIHKKVIGEYFKAIKEYHAMINPADIEIYAQKMFKQTN